MSFQSIWRHWLSGSKAKQSGSARLPRCWKRSGMHKGGKEYRRLVGAFEHIFGGPIFFGTDTLGGTARVVQRSRFSFFNEAQIWFSRNPDQYPVSDQFENVIVLSDEFYREITAHPIPADLEAIKVLAGTPAVLDLFMWLSYRCVMAKGREHSSVWAAWSSEPDWINRICSFPSLSGEARRLAGLHPRLWPEWPAKISSDRMSLVVDHAYAVIGEGRPR